MTEPYLRAYIMGMSLTPKSYPVLALALSGALLGGAWIFEYGFGYPPCQMCYWQRHAHKVIIGLAIVSLILAGRTVLTRRHWTALIVLAFAVSFALAFWHVGVEYKWWEGPKTCSGGGPITAPSTDILGSLGDPVKPPSCADAVWHFLGLSMAAWNAIASIGGAVLGICALRSKSDA